MKETKKEIINIFEKTITSLETSLVADHRYYSPQCSKHNNIIAGSAFTSYTCKICNTHLQHHNTATPKICRQCAITNNQCWYCNGKIIDIHTQIMPLIKKYLLI